MAGIFISYRREDASGHAGALMRALETHFPPKDVFLDITDIRGGEAFPGALAAAIRQADVVLVLIGARWLDARDAAGRRRLDDPADYVRHEVALGLRDAGRVIPILLDGTRMPSADELPDEIRALAIRNAMALSNRDWQRDVDLIVDEVRKASFAYRPASSDKAVAVPTDFKRGRAPARAWLLIGAAFLLFALIFLAVAGVLAWNTAAFLARAVQTEGTVVELAATGDGLFRPIIRFTTAGGETITFPAAQASTPPAYDIGETVGVAYDPARPRDARLKTGYLLEAIFAGFAALFGAIGGGIVAKAGGIRRRWRRKTALLSEGRPVMTAFREAELIDTITQNGRHPYRIVTAWDHPLTGEKVLFRSEHVWKDPTDLLKQRSIVVVIDPNNFENYLVDLSILPEEFTEEPGGGFDFSLSAGVSRRRARRLEVTERKSS